jgi:predicted acylesterase/phospholipase RssA
MAATGITPGVPQSQCDLVMKGGITSGIVYPPLFDVLHKKGFRFRNVGGTSAGAIAAAVTAAAQKGGEHGFEELREVTRWLGKGNNLLNLFRPTGGAAPLFKTFLAYSRLTLIKATPLRVFVALLSGDTAVFLGGALAGAAVAFLFAWSIRGGNLGELTPGFYVSLVLWVLVGSLGACAAHMYLILTGRLPENFFGICTGRDADHRKFDDTVLTDWLHVKINGLAGKGEDPAAPPLTFGELWKFPDGEKPNRKNERNIDLKMVTSNLSQNQPYVLPFEQSTFIFKEDEFRKLFPRSVVEHMTARQPRLEGFALPKGFYFLPDARELPVIVATRMSLSFPVLLGMVPLYTISRDAFEGEMRFEIVPPPEGDGRPTIVRKRKVIRRSVARPIPAGGDMTQAEASVQGEVVPEETARNLLRAQSLLSERFQLKENYKHVAGDPESDKAYARIKALEEEVQKLVGADEAEAMREEVRLKAEARSLRSEARALIGEVIRLAKESPEEAGRLRQQANELITEAQVRERAVTQTCALRVEWEPHKQTRVLEVEHLQPNWFSDGGICSNFPIQFFDAWLPTRPTFGVNLTSQLDKPERPGEQAADQGRAGSSDEDLAAVRRRSAYVVQRPSGYGEREADVYDQDVYLPKPDSVLAPEWIPIESLSKFLTSIFSTAQNYRDNMQALLPSYRERIVQIRLSDDEGGLNLSMPPEVIKAVMKKGEDAGAVLSTDFDFDQHQWVRFRVLMKKIEESLVRMNQVSREHRIYYDIANDVFDPSTYPYAPSDPAWLREVSERLRKVGDVIEAFQPNDLFNKDPQPFPEPQLRVAPEI